MSSPSAELKSMTCNNCNKRNVCKYLPKMDEVKKKILALQATEESLQEILRVEFKCKEFSAEAPVIISRDVH